MKIETTVYADILFFVNFSMDFITLWISAILTSRPRKALRMSLSAGIGALYAVLSLFISHTSILTYALAGGVSVLMCIIAFGVCGGFFGILRQSALIWGCGALLGGAMTAILSLGDYHYTDTGMSGGILSLVCAAAVVAVYITVRIICNVKNKQAVSVSVVWKNRTTEFSALCDSANLMRDPISGDPVIPVSSETVDELCGKEILTALLCLDSEGLTEHHVNPRLIPCKNLEGERLLCGFVPDRVTVTSGHKKADVRCVLVPRKCKKDYFAGHSASIPLSLIP